VRQRDQVLVRAGLRHRDGLRQDQCAYHELDKSAHQIQRGGLVQVAQYEELRIDRPGRIRATTGNREFSDCNCSVLPTDSYGGHQKINAAIGNQSVHTDAWYEKSQFIR